MPNTLMAAHNQKVTFDTMDYKLKERTPENNWLGQHNMKLFILEVNTLLQRMPATQPGFWSEVVILPNKPDMLAVIRKNGIGYNSPTDVALINLNPKKELFFTKNDLHAIAVAFQMRTVSSDKKYMGILILMMLTIVL